MEYKRRFGRLVVGQLVSGLALVLLLFATERSAHAHLFEFYLDGYGGGMYGTPQIAGYPHPPSPAGDNFFHNQSGGLLGAKVGIELLYTDLYVQFDQFLNGNGSGASLQLMLGWDFTLGRKENNRGLVGLLGGYGGVVFGFPYSPKAPIDKSQIAGFGVAGEIQGGIEYHLNRFLVLQALGTVGYHYLFRNLSTDGVMVDSQGNFDFPTSHGFHLLAKGGIRFHLAAL